VADNENLWRFDALRQALQFCPSTRSGGVSGQATAAHATQEGASFSDVFLESLEQGTSLHSAFEEGHWAARQGHPDQQPWLDDDEDGIANEAEDGEVAALRSLACETLAPAENWPPYVKAVAVEGLDGGQGEIQAQVQDDGAVAGVWVVIYPPSYAAPVSGEEMFGEPTPLVLEEHPTEEGWYTRVYTGFDELGEYRLVVHAEDDEAAQGRPKWSAQDFGYLRLCRTSISSRLTESLPDGFEELVTPFHLSVSPLVCHCNFLPHLGV
jgi:hypothetical protein